MSEIILYSTGCPKCTVLKKKLAAKNIDYVENSSVDDMHELGITYVPVLCVNGQLLNFADANKWINDR